MIFISNLAVYDYSSLIAGQAKVDSGLLYMHLDRLSSPE